MTKVLASPTSPFQSVGDAGAARANVAKAQGSVYRGHDYSVLTETPLGHIPLSCAKTCIGAMATFQTC